MSSLIAEILPLALAIALSPFPIIPAILLLFTAQARSNSIAFLTGWFSGILVGTAAFVLLASIIELADEPPTWASWTRLVLGLALIALGIKKWFGRSPDDASPAWMRSIDQLQPTGALRLSLVLSLANPKVLLLAAAAGIAIGSLDVGAGTTVVSIVVFAAIAASTVAVPVVLYLVRGPAILVPLGKVRAWLERHNAAVLAIVMVAIGVALSLKGIDGI